MKDITDMDEATWLDCVEVPSQLLPTVVVRCAGTQIRSEVNKELQVASNVWQLTLEWLRSPTNCDNPPFSARNIDYLRWAKPTGGVFVTLLAVEVDLFTNLEIKTLSWHSASGIH